MHNRTIDGLLGQASVATAKGDYTTATEILNEIIRQEPRKPEAYLQLAEVYEFQDDIGKSFEYRNLGCLLSCKTSAEDWEITGDMAVTIDRLGEAADCFARATRADRKNWIYYEKHIKVCEQMGMETEAMKIKLIAAQYVDCEKANFGFEWLQNMLTETSHHFYNVDDITKMLQTLTIFIQRSKQFKKEYTSHHDSLLKTLLELRDYNHVIQSILGICDGIEAFDEKGNKVYKVLDDFSIRPYPFTTEIARFEISEEFPTSMICRLIICFLNLEMIPPSKILINQLLSRVVDASMVDMYVTIAENLLHLNAHEDGLVYTKKLISDAPNLAGVWYLQGCFQHYLTELDNALVSYYKALDIQDDLVDARVNISSIFQQKNDMKSALEILSDYNLEKCTHLPDERLLLQQIDVFKHQKSEKQYCCAIRMILVPYFYEVMKQQESLLLGGRLRKQCFSVMIRRLALQLTEKSAFKAFVMRLGAATELNQNIYRGLKMEELFDYTVKLVEGLHDARNYTEMFHVLCFACIHPKISEVNYDHLEQLLILASWKSRNYVFTFEVLRYSIKQSYQLQQFSKIPKILLSSGFIISHYQAECVSKFFARLADLYPDNLHLKLITGNSSLITGYYKNALVQYAAILRQRDDDPLILLLSSICFLNMSCKRSITKQTALATRALTFMGKYRDSRMKNGPKQEVYYNMGRLFHQCDLTTQAVYWYEKVLAEPDPLIITFDPESGENFYVPSVKYSLKPTAALNYILIIQQSNPGKARQLRRKYCVI